MFVVAPTLKVNDGSKDKENRSNDNTIPTAMGLYFQKMYSLGIIKGYPVRAYSNSKDRILLKVE